LLSNAASNRIDDVANFMTAGNADFIERQKCIGELNCGSFDTIAGATPCSDETALVTAPPNRRGSRQQRRFANTRWPPQIDATTISTDQHQQRRDKCAGDRKSCAAMCLRQFGNRALPLFKRSGGCVLRRRGFSGKDHSTNDADTLARKGENLFVIYAMPAGARDDSDAGLNKSAIEVGYKVPSNASRSYLKAAVG